MNLENILRHDPVTAVEGNIARSIMPWAIAFFSSTRARTEPVVLRLLINVM